MQLLNSANSHVSMSQKATPSILLIDPEIYVGEIVQNCLQDLAHWDVHFTSSSREALILIQTIKFDVIILDILLSDMNGFAFLKKLRSNPKTCFTPVVLLTAKANWISLQQQQKYKILGAIPKPFDISTLPQQIASILDWELEQY